MSTPDFAAELAEAAEAYRYKQAMLPLERMSDAVEIYSAGARWAVAHSRLVRELLIALKRECYCADFAPTKCDPCQAIALYREQTEGVNDATRG